MSSPTIDYRECYICRNNYTKNQRAPVTLPCGHTYCQICIKRMCYSNIVRCPDCRTVSLFGPKELGKNIVLLDLLEKMNMLDSESDPQDTGASFSRSPLPEGVMDGLDVQSILKFNEFYFPILKQWSERQYDKLADQLTLSNDTQEAEFRHLHVARNCETFTNALDTARKQLKLYLTALNPTIAQRVPIYVEQVPMPEIFERYDPFHIEEFRPSRDFRQPVYIPPPGWNGPNRYHIMHPARNDTPREEHNEARDEDVFMPSTWMPASSLFQLMHSTVNPHDGRHS